jgi:hypothetical protein
VEAFQRIKPAQRSRGGQRSIAHDPLVIDDATAWLRGEGDMLTAGMGRVVPLTVQVGVLAHANLDRLSALGRYANRGSIRRTWGSDMARLAGELARFAASPERLRHVQAGILVPLELDLLAGGRECPSRGALIEYLYSVIPLSTATVSPIGSRNRR